LSGGERSAPAAGPRHGRIAPGVERCVETGRGALGTGSISIQGAAPAALNADLCPAQTDQRSCEICALFYPGGQRRLP
jgi:hypothetical protein